MVQKDISQLVVDKAAIEEKLKQLRQDYLNKREELIKPLRTEYDKKRKELEQEEIKLLKLIGANHMDIVMNRGPRQLIDDNNYGWTVKTIEK